MPRSRRATPAPRSTARGRTSLPPRARVIDADKAWAKTSLQPHCTMRDPPSLRGACRRVCDDKRLEGRGRPVWHHITLRYSRDRRRCATLLTMTRSFSDVARLEPSERSLLEQPRPPPLARLRRAAPGPSARPVLRALPPTRRGCQFSWPIMWRMMDLLDHALVHARAASNALATADTAAAETPARRSPCTARCRRRCSFDPLQDGGRRGAAVAIHGHAVAGRRGKPRVRDLLLAEQRCSCSTALEITEAAGRGRRAGRPTACRPRC